MTKAQSQVRAFHEAMGATIGDSPAIRDAELRAKLILEEAFETVEALLGCEKGTDLIEAMANARFWGCGEQDHIHSEPCLVGVTDGLCDLQYVLLGTAIACGIDLEPFADEVHASNMSKLPVTRRSDGKVMKGPNYKPPRIAEMLAKLEGK